MSRLFAAAILLLLMLLIAPDKTTADDLHIVIKKSGRTLTIVNGRRVLKRYQIALGFTQRGDKQIEGDGKTPEGEFYIFTKNDQSKFYLSLGLSYPNAGDAKRGLKAKLITQEQYDQIIDAIGRHEMPPQDTALGGEIYIHGGGTEKDWTEGCVAVADTDMREIFDAATIGMRVIVHP